MERRIKEEGVTKKVIEWLIYNGWEIVCYDFPQSGTGKAIHPNMNTSKTESIIIPDIVAKKGEKALYFENKDRFVLEDFHKVYDIKTSNIYSDGLRRLLGGEANIYFGVAYPLQNKDVTPYIYLVDFIVNVDCNTNECLITYDKDGVLK